MYCLLLFQAKSFPGSKSKMALAVVEALEGKVCSSLLNMSYEDLPVSDNKSLQK